ncbi:MAG TPA: hypothetical protein VFP48_04905 [Steroidobacteraceae bacterium]|nr:hypothetical protein [Steroidobacteraceae bacterium]
MALLGQLQSLLAGLYDTPVEHDVHDFLITDPQFAAALQSSAAPPPTDEQLLIAETGDGLAMSLFLHAEVLERLGRHCPLQSLDEQNLQDYCTALEGVSHFHYVSWSTGCDRSVSLLELELQAEVDKYASALALLLAQRDGRFPGELFRRLFEGAQLLPHLDDAERERYTEAHRFAARFCRRLEERFLRRRQARPAAMLAELRSFYRLGRHAKLRYAAG